MLSERRGFVRVADNSKIWTLRPLDADRPLDAERPLAISFFISVRTNFADKPDLGLLAFFFGGIGENVTNGLPLVRPFFCLPPFTTYGQGTCPLTTTSPLTSPLTTI
jgi:hypothetical protein